MNKIIIFPFFSSWYQSQTRFQHYFLASTFGGLQTVTCWSSLFFWLETLVRCPSLHQLQYSPTGVVQPSVSLGAVSNPQLALSDYVQPHSGLVQPSASPLRGSGRVYYSGLNASRFCVYCCNQCYLFLNKKLASFLVIYCGWSFPQSHPLLVDDISHSCQLS